MMALQDWCASVTAVRRIGGQANARHDPARTRHGSNHGANGGVKTILQLVGRIKTVPPNPTNGINPLASNAATLKLAYFPEKPSTSKGKLPRPKGLRNPTHGTIEINGLSRVYGKFWLFGEILGHLGQLNRKI
jgi:hypothetical protein